MKRPITIRNGLCRFFPGFRGEWQIKKPLVSILPYRSSPKAFCTERMKELYDWFNQVEIDYWVIERVLVKEIVEKNMTQMISSIYILLNLIWAVAVYEI